MHLLTYKLNCIHNKTSDYIKLSGRSISRSTHDIVCGDFSYLIKLLSNAKSFIHYVVPNCSGRAMSITSRALKNQLLFENIVAVISYLVK